MRGFYSCSLRPSESRVGRSEVDSHDDSPTLAFVHGLFQVLQRHGELQEADVC